MLLAVLVSSAVLKSPAKSPGAAGNLRAEMGLHPVMDSGGCVYVPDETHPRFFPCASYNDKIQYVYLGRPVHLGLNVSSPDGAPFKVTVWWDSHLNQSQAKFYPELSNASAVEQFDVTPTGANVPVHIDTEWTYWNMSEWIIVGGQSSFYNVFVNVTGASGFDPYNVDGCYYLPYGSCYFQVAVAINLPPSLNGLQGEYTYRVSFPNPAIPRFMVNATVQDSDNERVNVTWEWGDGNVSVDHTPPAMQRTWVNVSHRYWFPLNVTPRNVYFYVNVSVDDGQQGHNVTFPVEVFYYVGYDGMPILSILSPVVGSPWELDESVPMEGTVVDPQGDAMLYYWDYGDGNLSAEVSTYDATVYSAHAYSVTGSYNITLWATDGLNKSLCLDANCTQTRSHWVNISLPIQVHPNRAPFAALTVSSNPGVYGREAGFTVSVLDQDWDDLTITWAFGDGTWAVNRTTGASTVVQVPMYHNYSLPGNPPNYTYRVTVWADDGRGHNVTNSTVIFVGSRNMPPSVSALLLLTNNTVHATDLFSLNVTVNDPEGDPVWISIDFGDGETWNGENTSMTPNVNYTVPVEHAYSRTGNFTINITVTDHQIWVQLDPESGKLITLLHNISTAAVIEVQAAPPPPISTEWNWVDYATLAVVLAVPIAAAIRAGYRRYQERKED